MGGHRCEYYDAWIFGKYGKAGYWNSDTNYRSNSDSVTDVPVHASIERLSTGTCVDYSFALTTFLRKIGYSKDDVMAITFSGYRARRSSIMSIRSVTAAARYSEEPVSRISIMLPGILSPGITTAPRWMQGARMTFIPRIGADVRRITISTPARG
jgi:hypothetical protein